jgi:tetratricopeptide (TPR) repeat protein
MSEKKAKHRKSGSTKPAKPTQPALPIHDADLDILPTMNPRAMEKMMADITRLLNQQGFQTEEEANEFLEALTASGQPPVAPPQTPLEEAQNIMYEAWEARGGKRVKLARQALKISPDCADAYVLLAEEAARNIEEARDFYKLGVQAGQRALGPEMFEENAGHFWGILETRPYMRAREGLARTLWWLGRHRESVEHLWDMLRLNPGDNQGIRYPLSARLLEMGDDDALERLVNQYKEEESASWLYTRALMLFRIGGANAKSNRALQKAIRINPFVPPYLLGKKRLPKKMPEYMGWGDENEAIDCAAGLMKSWQMTPGALEWMAKRWEG